MQTFKVVMPEHLNQRGYLFGGVLLSWVDEYAWMAATWEYPCCDFVTISVDKAIFKHGVHQGSILRFEIKKERLGRTSVMYNVDVYARAPQETEQVNVFSTSVTLVRLDGNGLKCPITDC